MIVPGFVGSTYWIAFDALCEGVSGSDTALFVAGTSRPMPLIVVGVVNPWLYGNPIFHWITGLIRNPSRVLYCAPSAPEIGERKPTWYTLLAASAAKGTIGWLSWLAPPGGRFEKPLA